MKVTVNACRKKRTKVDVTAVNTRRDIVRVPVKRINQYTGPAPEEENEDIREDYDEAELSAIFDSSEFQDPYYPEESGLPEIFVKPVRMLNELADSRPELDDLPPYFNPRLMTEEEEAAEYSAPERLVKDGGKERDASAGRAGAAGDGTGAARKANAGEPRRAGRRPAEQDIAENYTTEELLAIIESQQQEKKRRDRELAEQKKQREIERAEKARKYEEEITRTEPTREEISREEDTLFMWWSELDSKDAANTEEGGVSDDSEAFTQMQITDDIPKPRKRRRKKARPALTDAVPQEETGARAGNASGEVFDNIRGAFSTGTGEEEDDASGEVFDSIRGAFAGEVETDDGDADEETVTDAMSAGGYVPEEIEEQSAAGYAEEEYAGDAYAEEEYAGDAYAEEEYEEEDPDTSVNVRYFDRDKHGGRVEVERSEAIGQEVVVIDNESGKMKRICGIIKHGQPAGDADAGSPGGGAEK